MNNLSNATHSPPKLCHENMFLLVTSASQQVGRESCIRPVSVPQLGFLSVHGWHLDHFYMFQAGTVVELSKHRYQPNSNYVIVLV